MKIFAELVQYLPQRRKTEAKVSVLFLYYSIATLLVMEEKTIKSRYTFVQKNTSLAHIKAEIISAVYRIVSTAQAFKH